MSLDYPFVEQCDSTRDRIANHDKDHNAVEFERERGYFIARKRALVSLIANYHGQVLNLGRDVSLVNGCHDATLKVSAPLKSVKADFTARPVLDVVIHHITACFLRQLV